MLKASTKLDFNQSSVVDRVFTGATAIPVYEMDAAITVWFRMIDVVFVAYKVMALRGVLDRPELVGSRQAFDLCDVLEYGATPADVLHLTQSYLLSAQFRIYRR